MSYNHTLCADEAKFILSSSTSISVGKRLNGAATSWDSSMTQ